MTDFDRNYLEHYAANRTYSSAADIQAEITQAQAQLAELDHRIDKIQAHHSEAADFARRRADYLRELEADVKEEIASLRSKIAATDAPDLAQYVRLANLELAHPKIVGDMTAHPGSDRTYEAQVKTLTQHKREVEKRLRAMHAEKHLRQEESAGPLQKLRGLITS